MKGYTAISKAKAIKIVDFVPVAKLSPIKMTTNFSVGGQNYSRSVDLFSSVITHVDITEL